MLDLVRLTLLAGNGGHGKVSFRREKFIPKGGPDGGKGGNGGSVIFRANASINTLQSFSGLKKIEARSGQNGGSTRSFGHGGDDVLVEVPVGTTVWVLGENEASRKRRLHAIREGRVAPEPIFDQYQVATPRDSGIAPRAQDEIHEYEWTDLAEEGITKPSSAPITVEEQTEDSAQIIRSASNTSTSHKNIRVSHIPKVEFFTFTEDGQELVVCQGGLGGRGNEVFKSSMNTTPLQAEYGTFGEQKDVLLELKLLADVGLIGLPNAGKSTLLSILTKANPKIASYPFTTLEPKLGVMSVLGGEEQRDLVLADIPGLIEGASQGKGLGFDFLRHLEACHALLFLLTLEESLVFDPENSPEKLAELLLKQYTLLEKELLEYSDELLSKPRVLAISKADLYQPEQRQAISEYFAKAEQPIFFFSAITGENIDTLRLKLGELA